MEAFSQEVVALLSGPEVVDEILVSRVDFHRRAVAFKAING